MTITIISTFILTLNLEGVEATKETIKQMKLREERKRNLKCQDSSAIIDFEFQRGKLFFSLIIMKF